MQFPTFLAIAIVFTLWLTYELKKSSPNRSNFWDREREANQVRKKPLDDLYYITIPINSLPFFSGIDEKLETYQEELRTLSQTKIVDLSAYTNTDLKMKFGPANLQELSSYDQHFTQLVRLLYQWSARLHELSYDQEAIRVLEFGIECGTDMHSHYLLLAQLYQNQGRFDKVSDLIERAKNLQSLLKDSIVRDLSAML
jgi:hypothetical protein